MARPSRSSISTCVLLFFFHDTATTEIYTLSLHDALPICGREPEAAKAITGYLPDHPFLYDKLTAREFLRFVGGLYGLGGGELERRAGDLLAQFGLAERAGELTETYSHGMKQRLALAAALVHRPRILVLDEPMVGLDPQGTVALRRLLVELPAAARRDPVDGDGSLESVFLAITGAA